MAAAAANRNLVGLEAYVVGNGFTPQAFEGSAWRRHRFTLLARERMRDRLLMTAANLRMRLRPGRLVITLLLAGLLVAIAVLALVPNSVLIQCYFQPWCALGLDPAAFGEHYSLIARIGHIMAFAVLSGVLLRMTRLRPWHAVVIAAGFAVLLEASQAMTSTRAPRLADLLASLAGVGIGLCFKNSRRFKSLDMPGR